MPITTSSSLQTVSVMPLAKTARPETLQSIAADFRKLALNPYNNRFDAHMLLQAKQELDLLLTNQVTPTQSTQSLEAQLVRTCRLNMS